MTRKYSEKLIKLRGDKTQQQTADAIGISREAYSNYETCRRFPRPEALLKISKYYCLTVDEIFFNDDCDV